MINEFEREMNDALPGISAAVSLEYAGSGSFVVCTVFESLFRHSGDSLGFKH